MALHKNENCLLQNEASSKTERHALTINKMFNVLTLRFAVVLRALREKKDRLRVQVSKVLEIDIGKRLALLNRCVGKVLLYEQFYSFPLTQRIVSNNLCSEM